MRKCASLFFITALFSLLALNADETFTPFTGQVTRDKVRLRVQPNLDCAVIRELMRNEMLVITGESEDFYSVAPPADIKSFIYRTFVLDGVVEGTKVNVRLQPDTEAPIIAQLNSGERVEGTISDAQSKWLEIAPPQGVQLYVAKDYIKKVGDSSMLGDLMKRSSEVDSLLKATLAMGAIEIEKPFQAIAIDDIHRNLDVIANEYPEFPEQAAKAREFQEALKARYTQKKIAYLEAQANGIIPPQVEQNITAQTVCEPFENLIAYETVGLSGLAFNTADDPKMEQWLSSEKTLFESWSKENDGSNMSNYYDRQRAEAITLKGVIEPYQRPVRNKPGDYVLLNRVNRLPVAFLYSTVVNLQHFEDQEVTIQAVERPNNNFAFPAYFVLSVE